MYGGELSYSLFGWEITQNQNGDYFEKKSLNFDKSLFHLVWPSVMLYVSSWVQGCLWDGTAREDKEPTHPHEYINDLSSTRYWMDPLMSLQSQRERGSHCSRIVTVPRFSNLSMMDLNSRFFNNGLAGWRR